MTIAMIAVGALVAIFIVVEVVLRLVARRERQRFDRMTPGEQRKYQEDMHKAQARSNS